MAEYAAVAKKHGLTPTELALAWCKQKWQVISDITGLSMWDTVVVRNGPRSCRIHGALHKESGEAGCGRVCSNRQEARPDAHRACACLVQGEVAGSIHHHRGYQHGAAQGGSFQIAPDKSFACLVCMVQSIGMLQTMSVVIGINSMEHFEVSQ